MRNKKQQKILSMIDGYDSIETLSTAMSTIFLVWLLPAFGALFVAFVGFGAGTDADSISTFRQLIQTLQVAEAVLGFFTVCMFVYWVFRARENVRRLGKRPKIGLGQIFLRHCAAVLVAVGAFAVAVLVPSLFTAGVVVGLLSLVWFGLMFNMMSFSAVQLLWRTSSQPTGSEDELPGLGLVWIVTWVISSWALGAVQTPSGAEVSFSVGTEAIALAIHGFALGAAAFSIALLIRQIAARQESRLLAIIAYVDVDVAGANGAVTTDQINNAWDASNNLVDFNR